MRSWGWRLIFCYDKHVDLLKFSTFRRSVVFPSSGLGNPRRGWCSYSGGREEWISSYDVWHLMPYGLADTDCRFERTHFVNFHVSRLWKFISSTQKNKVDCSSETSVNVCELQYVPEDGNYKDVFLVFSISRRYQSTRDACRLSSIWCDGWSICFDTYWVGWLIEHAYKLCQLMSCRCFNCCFCEGLVWKWWQSTSWSLLLGFGGHTEENMHVKKNVGCWYGNKVEYANLKLATCGICGKYEAVLVGSWTLRYVTGYC